MEFPAKNKYDLITLFDVLEHIPKEIHSNVFKRINEISNSNTIIIMTIPDPDYLAYIREHSSEKLQLVDESIYLDEMMQILKENNLEVLVFEKYGIDYDAQYNFYLLCYNKIQYEMSPIFGDDNNFLVRYFDKLVTRVNRISGQLRYGKYLK